MKVCVTSYVFGTYKRFIPIFCYSVVRSYPQYHVKVFVDGVLGEPEKKCITDIQRNVSRNVSVVERSFEGIVVPEEPVLRGGQRKFFRWIFEQTDFEGFDCVYFSDVDFLVLTQEPALAEFHAENARNIGLPFSNKVRADKANTRRGSRRLSGLHFVLADEYFPRVDPVVRKFKQNPGLIAREVPYATTDEHFLYHTVRSAISFDSESMCRTPRPVPGFHLAWSQNPQLLEQRTARMLKPYRGSIPYFKNIPDQLRFFCSDPVFLRVLWRQNVPELIVMLSYIGIRPKGVCMQGKFATVLLTVKVQFWSRVIRHKLGLASHRHRR